MKRRWVIVLNLVVVFSLLGIVLYTLMAPHKATHAASTGAECWASTCFKKDPTEMGCLTTTHASPYREPEYYQGQLVAYLSSFYSYDCNSNWVQAELTPYAINQGWKVCTFIRAFDTKNPFDYVIYPDHASFPVPSASGAGLGDTTNGCYTDSNPNHWPIVSNMVNGNDTTFTTLYLVDQNNKVLQEYTAQQ